MAHGRHRLMADTDTAWLILALLCFSPFLPDVHACLSVQEEEDVSFAGGMVQALNLILLTSSALQELRGLLQASLRSAEAADVFAQLFASWSHSCAASLALALLAQVKMRQGCSTAGWQSAPGRQPRPRACVNSNARNGEHGNVLDARMPALSLHKAWVP